MQPFSSEEFELVYSKVPRLTVDLVIRLNGGIVLTLRSLPTWNGQWHFPGGTVYYEETIEQTAKRVAFEELGISIHIDQTLGYLEYPSEKKERGFGNSISVVLLCDALGNSFKVDEQAEKAEVFTALPDNMIVEQKQFFIDHADKIQ